MSLDGEVEKPILLKQDIEIPTIQIDSSFLKENEVENKMETESIVEDRLSQNNENNCEMVDSATENLNSSQAEDNDEVRII